MGVIQGGVVLLVLLAHGVHSHVFPEVNHFGQELSRTKRQFPTSVCSLEKFLCRQNPTEVEQCKAIGAVCVRVDVILIPQPTCHYRCEQKPPETTVYPNVTDVRELNITEVVTFENETTELKNEISSITPTLQGNGNGTIPFTTEVSSASWRDDPAYCNEAYYCQNGGSCVPGYREGIRNKPHCICINNFTGIFCEDGCSLQCKHDAACMVNENGTQYCTEPGRPSASREEPEKMWYWPVIAGCVILLAAVLVYLIILKLRGRSLLVTKIFHYFQPYEDDDGKEFDVFISFRSSNRDFSQSDDEQFVIRVLQPRLENDMRCRVCVHYRDFQPGETIANNIMWAVENSRRTLLVLSPLYVESEWARMEYQKAQQEMYKLRHKIIPIIFRDLSKTTIEDPTLKNILGSVTYIEYPPETSTTKEKERFWKMLQLALPKKRDTTRPTTFTSKDQSSLPDKNCPVLKGHSFISQESCVSTRTDTTEVPNMDSIKSNGVSGNTVVDISEIEKLQILSGKEKRAQDEKISESVAMYTAVLEPPS